ncbi:MAG: 1-deoxy-D-xylulose-5-phosphate reductoisomerase [Clostridia bacterium]|nr:1-deoxy-D-xylulose-5-phosphate reductoisomerase [Clostridia bacterium]
MTGSLILLGSTGSIGTQTLDVCRKNGICVYAVAGHGNVKALEEQVREFRPALCGVADPSAAADLKVRIADTCTKVITGAEAAEYIASVDGCDTVLNAVSGVAGLRPTLAAISSGKKRLALANKESIVTAGHFVMSEAKKHGTEIIPVDSEHSAVFQCLNGQKIRRVILTASGGPFYGMKTGELLEVTPEKALSHPTWSMGSRISIDSATLMNKGFEVIEAIHLFGLSPDQVEVVVHRQSIVHSMVEYADGSIIAEMGCPDMRLCIQYALSYPERSEGFVHSFDFSRPVKLTFGTPDCGTFRLLPLAYRACKLGGTVPAAMNAADEEAVRLFLDGKVGFEAITDAVEKITLETPAREVRKVEDVEEADRDARERTSAFFGISRA